MSEKLKEIQGGGGSCEVSKGQNRPLLRSWQGSGLLYPWTWVAIEKNDALIGAVTCMGLSDRVQRDTSQMLEATNVGALLQEMSRLSRSSEAECRRGVAWGQCAGR